MLPPFALERPTTIDGVLDAISEEALPYCGGTELLLAMRIGLLRPQTLVDLKHVPELAVIDRFEHGLRLGAAVTHAQIASSELVHNHLPVAAAVAGSVGNARVRSQGTIGGNVCFAEPKSDVTVLLAALEASLNLASPAGTRRLSIMEFLEGAYATTRRDDELLTSIDIPLHERIGVHCKYQPLERPTVGVVVTSNVDGADCRVVVGAVGELPCIVEVASLDDVEPATVADAVEPIPDLSGSSDYKRHVTAVYVERAVDQLRVAVA